MTKQRTAAKTTTQRNGSNGSLTQTAGTQSKALSPTEAKLVKARLGSTSLRTAAVAAGIPWSTAHLIWSREWVQEAFYRECQRVYEQGLRRAQGASGLATETLIKLLNTKSAQTRLSAANALLRRSDIAVEELDTKRRLDELEAKAQGR
jgi:hypothetical protein